MNKYPDNIDFDDQANTYDKRVGLPTGVAPMVAKVIDDLTFDLNTKEILEIGTGTGEIGIELGNIGNKYTGFDTSSRMLEKFKERKSFRSSKHKIIEHNGNVQWPVGDNTINVIFSSRALHMLKIKHVISEIQRVGKKGTVYVILGRVERDFHGVKSTIRRIMRTILKKFHYTGRSGHKERSELFEELKSYGGEAGAPVTVAKWTTYHSPRKSLDSWKNKDGLAGLNLDLAVKSKILEEVLVEASRMYKDLDTAYESEEWYELNFIKINIP